MIRKYYFLADGRRYTGKNKYARVGNKYYWFNSKSQASIKRGWANVGNYRMYLSTKGVPYKGTKKIGKYYYYFDSRGRMQGNKIINGYYFLKDGRRYTGRNRFVKVGNRYYWINSKRKATIKKGGRRLTGRDTTCPVRALPTKATGRSEGIITISTARAGCRRIKSFPVITT